MKINHIYNEDCLKTMQRFETSSIDMMITSPPYDNMRKYSGNTFSQFTSIAKELHRVLKLGGVLVWIVNDQTKEGDESGTSFRQALYFKRVGFNLFDTMIYLKPPRGACGDNRTYWQSFEYMFVLSKEKPKTINLIRDRENKDSRDGDVSNKRLFGGELKQVIRKGYDKTGRRTNVWQYNIGKGHSASDSIAYGHPAIFPEELAKDHILSWSNVGEIVYDPFMGSGTTAKMAILTGRNFVGSEIYEPYAAIANKRLQEIFKEKQKRIPIPISAVL